MGGKKEKRLMIIVALCHCQQSTARTPTAGTPPACANYREKGDLPIHKFKGTWQMNIGLQGNWIMFHKKMPQSLSRKKS